MEEILTGEHFASVRADSAVSCIVEELRGFVNSTQFKQLMTTGQYYQTHSQPTRRWCWIADTR